MNVRPAASRRTVGAVATLTIALAAVASYQFWGVLQDTVVALRYRFALDYGEGIVWQQALLMFGPRMYSASPELPLIVFHYPPLYHIIVRGLMTLRTDPLFAGRLISAVAAGVAASCIVALILASVPAPRSALQRWLAVIVAVTFLCLPVIRVWGVLMRVDMLAETLGLLGTVVFVVGRGSTMGTTVALLLCVASVFTKQTQLPAGIAVFLGALVCAPRAAWIAALVAGSAGIACAAGLEMATGGFFKNIVAYNINPFTIADARSKIWIMRESGPFVVLSLLGALRFKREDGWARLRGRDRRTIAETVVALHFILACISSLEILKDGSSDNYFIDLLASGSILIGMMLCAASTKPLALSAVAVLLALSTANLRHRYFGAILLGKSTAESEQSLERVVSVDGPVASDDMVLLMRAGKSIVFEPAIVRVLVAEGKWDPAPLLAMIRNHGFAFAITYADGSQSGPLVTQAIEAAYPRKEELPRGLTAHYAP